MSVTIRELLDRGHLSLQQVGIENPRHAVELMLGAILGLRRIDLFLDINRAVDSAAEVRFNDMVGRKLYREPLQYIIGSTEWFGVAIKCDRRALIPRPETEIVLERALEIIKDVRAPRIADIGTGTGCIAIAAALNREDATIVATDLSATALQLAQENVIAHQLAHRILLRPGALLEPLQQEVFDLIISNPPYVRESEYPTLMPEVRDFEPRNALVAGDDGLECVRSLIQLAPHRLAESGVLVIEFGIDHATPVSAIARHTDAYLDPEIIIDYNQRERGILLRKK